MSFTFLAEESCPQQQPKHPEIVLKSVSTLNPSKLLTMPWYKPNICNHIGVNIFKDSNVTLGPEKNQTKSQLYIVYIYIYMQLYIVQKMPIWKEQNSTK